jgi:hypothetical protein
VSHSRVAVSETSVSLARAMSAASGGECDPQGFTTSWLSLVTRSLSNWRF